MHARSLLPYRQPACRSARHPGRHPGRQLADRLACWPIAVTAAVLLATALVAGPTTAAPNPQPTNAQPGGDTVTDQPELAVATLAGGCFWCTEAVFERMAGVHDVISGYIGGKVPNPSYEAVCSGLTGHAEAVEIHYDPTVVSFEALLKAHFASHDPTTLNRQGGDTGTQYRSAVFFHNDEQKEKTQQFIQQLSQQPEFRRRPIVTTLEPAGKFYVAEPYHQDYYQKNPTAGYCQVVVRPKVAKFEKEFKDQLKQD